MVTQLLDDFEKMNWLAQSKKPFFFMVDFLKKNVEIYEEKDLALNNILIDFPEYKTEIYKKKIYKKFKLKSYPISSEDYEHGFKIIQNHLKKGNSYLANYTCKTPIECNYNLEEIYLHSNAKYKVKYKDQFVFFSPETFVKIIDNHIYTHPMKGTIDAQIPNAKDILKSNPKEKAEHFTVVDLLRNDLSIVANKVRVKDFQRIDYIPTNQKNLYGMSSEISGILRPDYQKKIGSILNELLPAGSILGAPKKKTLEIILQAETYDRGWYTGISGWFDGQNLDSCVMIRFIEKNNENFYFKSGGGITHLSNFAEEYLEMKNKIYVPIY